MELIVTTREELAAQIREAISEALSQPQPQKTPPAPLADLLTAKQLADLLGVHRFTIMRWRDAGKIKEHRIGARVFFSRSEVAQTMQGND